MSIYILTSWFPNGFNNEIAQLMKKFIKRRTKFAFIASEFEKNHEKTDQYFEEVLGLFQNIGIDFEKSYVVDGRMEKEVAKDIVRSADVVWLAGGDTPTEYQYLLKYELIDILREHSGVIIGMSAGSINLTKMAICTLACGHDKQEMYEGIGCVGFSVEPHFNVNKVSKELLELSKQYIIYGLCDESLILCEGKTIIFLGEVYQIIDGTVKQISV
ncbi:MAG TPA: hypothetical protein DIT54_05030 [Lachnospiraceae bacterium]|nr:hypothetical protein [Lachnospiraceae bacterium]